MKTTPLCSLHRRLFVLSSFSLLLGAATLQSQAVNGDLSVAGSLDVSGPVFNLGTWTNDTARLGLNITYAEDASHAASLSLAATRPLTRWQWSRAASAPIPPACPR